ncbi:MAG: peptidoglycan editing factor PgeF [Rhodanobacter sp.]|nr:MAG: peptidoglycan editing factor PgeF [Rhodanobacter sp.]TAM08835.1 MAG: peptidoglycan editing factor PgeF [Rhodanobacter sp.]TAM36877.1 MAG: peptidoglycan editing factor PgeF [Rhodanobacter sp.]
MSQAFLIPDWPVPLHVHAAVSTRELAGCSAPPFGHANLGTRSGESADVVQRNRVVLRDALGLPAEPRWLHQVHGRHVVAQGAVPPGAEPEADAAVTRLPGTVLAILTADCLPLLFASADGSVVAAAHAGWRGLAAGVMEATLTAMSCAPSQVVAWLGPCIGGPSYEVGEEVRTAFVDHAASAAACFVPTRPGHWHCDLAALARQRLMAAGVAGVHGGGFDTYTDLRFYSYRREGARSGRFASLVWIDARG